MEQGHKKYLYVIAVLLVLLVGMYFWKVMAVKNVREKLDAQKIQVIEKAHQALSDNTRYFLRLATTPLTWAIRKELLRENLEQINDYTIQFVKDPHVKLILVVKEDGMVAVSTDKSKEGVAFSSLYPVGLLEKDEIVITEEKNGTLLITAPIMGLNKKLGMLLMSYEPEKISFDTVQNK